MWYIDGVRSFTELEDVPVVDDQGIKPPRVARRLEELVMIDRQPGQLGGR